MKRTAEDTDRVVTIITERSAYWTSQGYVGARLYERLASDSGLPENLDGKVIAEFENKQPALWPSNGSRAAGRHFCASHRTS